jgi:hypothetical protein
LHQQSSSGLWRARQLHRTWIRYDQEFFYNNLSPADQVLPTGVIPLIRGPSPSGSTQTLLHA